MKINSKNVIFGENKYSIITFKTYDNLKNGVVRCFATPTKFFIIGWYNISENTNQPCLMVKYILKTTVIQKYIQISENKTEQIKFL